MSSPRQFEILPVVGAIAIRIVNTVTPNQFEYYQFSAIKSVVPVQILGMGVRNPQDNQRKSPIEYDNKLEFVINFHDENETSPVRYDIQGVQNQGGWTPDVSGLTQALSDINSWIGAAASSGAAILAVLTPGTVVHTPIVTSAVGTVAAGTLRGSVFNSGGAAGIWNGISLPAGIGLPWPEISNRYTYQAMPYDATGTVFIIESTT